MPTVNKPIKMASRGETFVVRLTGGGPSALASVRLEGPDALDLASRLFAPRNGRPLATCRLAAPILGRWTSTSGSEEVVLCRRDEGVIEIHCHGGAMAPQAIILSLQQLGAMRLEWEEWIRRRGGDPITIQARIELAKATTPRSAAILLDQQHGALSSALQTVVSQIDSGQIGAAQTGIEKLLDYAAVGTHLAAPFRVAILGTPNAGKSSLLNALVGYRRALVYHAPGTTRDIVAAQTAIDGWPVELLDTAGLRSTDDPLERQGIAYAQTVAAEADLVILCVPRNQPWDEQQQALLASQDDALWVATKADLPRHPQARAISLETSVVTGIGIESLLAEVARRLVPTPPMPGAALPFTSDQVATLRRVREALERSQPAHACRLLKDLLGTK
jgi:tRNA modification GTPase